jgi:hypothetical protein
MFLWWQKNCLVEINVFMKRITALLFGCWLLAACNNATDGDADTDTTNFPIDTNRFTDPTDSIHHENSNTGTLIDSVAVDKQGGEGASKKTPATSRKTTPHDPARIDTMRQRP